MVSKPIVRALTVVAAGAALLISACKSSTGPSDPFVGSWQVAAAVTPNGGASAPLTPNPFTLTISKNGTLYAASYPRLTWTPSAPYSFSDSATSSAAAGLFVSGDSLYIQGAETTGVPCNLYLIGIVQGNTAQGTAAIQGCSQSGTGTWTATRQ